MTPSDLGDRLDASTSDIMMQLETLANAGLVEQTPGEGFNTVYTPTEKATTIVDNGSAQATFSIGASGIAGLLGLGLMGQASGLIEQIMNTSGTTSAEMAGSRAQPAPPPDGSVTVPETATEAAGIDPVMMVAGIVLLAVCGILLHYGRNIRHLING